MRYAASIVILGLLAVGTAHSSSAPVPARAGFGPYLGKLGTCPGWMALTVDHATINGPVAFLHGAPGTFVQQNLPCMGLTLGLASPTLVAVVQANGSGFAAWTFRAPSAACGRSVQAVDVTACAATNVILL